MIHQNGGFYYLWTDSGKWEIAQAWWLKTGLIGFERNEGPTENRLGELGSLYKYYYYYYYYYRNKRQEF